ncbi:DUF2752 domain-containing protein [Blastopirellula marina]|uniref:DUF2752 domain-containing protein n=2 Tax=Blastopirellula marina TaxID=124 RepID=A0A2S8FLW7_9BACT|nr:hypothetical protein C5Y98_18560 [Blastopirellula marina]PTL43314.1 DUF2752 domain-containing protein [Blastopirellula marina]
MRGRWLFHALMLAIALPVLGLSFLLTLNGPSLVMIPWLGIPLPPTCGMQNTFGLDCPGCGLTRSFIALAHGDLTASLAFNPGGILVFGLVLFQVPYRIAQLLRVRSGQETWDLTTVSLWFWSLIGVVLFAQWVGKLVL